MKAAIVTFIRAYNYGAVLQCYALNEILRKIGIQCETLDYFPDYFRQEYSMDWATSLSRRNCSHKQWVRRLYGKYVVSVRNKGFERFIARYISLSQFQYQSSSELKDEKFDYDCYIAGSDQIWHSGCSRFDPVYFLDFPDARHKPRFSYAASFGNGKISEELKDEYIRRLKGFSLYSVREKSGAQILMEMLQEKAEVCCDPTLLLSKQEWGKICGAPRNVKPYILIYYVTKTKTLQEYACRLAKEKKMKVICVPCHMTLDVVTGYADRQYKFDFRASCGPEEFLRLFRDAKYVLTNSFHGTVFSVIFQKQFLVQTKLDDGNSNNRALELLKDLGIHDRDLIDNYDQIDKGIQWDEVEERRKHIAEKATNYLMRIKMRNS